MAANAASVTTYQSVEAADGLSPPDSTIVEKTAIGPLTVPYGTRDAITDKLINNGMKMADFSGEIGRGRYYSLKTFRSLDVPKRNPFDRALIKEVLYYIAAVARKPTSGGGDRRSSRRRSGGRRTRRQPRNTLALRKI